MRMKVMIATFVLILLLAAPVSAAAINGSNGVNGNGFNGNLIVINPEDCPEGTVPVLIELLDLAVPGLEDNGNNEFPMVREVYECVQVTPLTPDTPSGVEAVQEDAYPAETAAASPRTHLPSTGLMLLPAAVAALAGAGLFKACKRS